MFDCFHNALARVVDMNITGISQNETDELAKTCFNMLKQTYIKEYSEMLSLFHGTHVSEISDIETGKSLSLRPEPFSVISLSLPSTIPGTQKIITIFDCMDLYCKVCLINHSTLCKNICRFCKMTEYKLPTGKMSITKCSTCTGYYCALCFPKHKKRTDKYGVEHTDKCKKVLSTKLIQGDIVEEPNYITKHNLLIDYMYYLERQIENPIYQILRLMLF